MSKNTKRTTTDKPQSAQVDAVRRLVDEGKFEEARTRLQALRQRFPKHRPLLALAWEVEDEAGDLWHAVARAFDWVQASPGSAAALSALEGAAFFAGMPALGAATSMQLALLEGKVVAPLPPMPTPFGPLSMEDSVLVDISRLLLQDARYDETIDRLRGVTNSALRNNRALAYFAKGETAQALEEFEDIWRTQPLNLFSLERVIRLRIWHQGRDSAKNLVEPLLTTMPMRAEDALGKLTGLILLNEWYAAEASWQAESNAGYWSDRDDGVLHGLFAYLGAVVAVRSGDANAAQERLRQAEGRNPNHLPIFDLSAALLLKSDAGGYIVEVGEFGAWFPMTWCYRMAELRDSKKMDIEQQLRRQFALCDAHADYLGLAVELGGKWSGTIATKILRQRATQGDPAAKEQLVSFLTRPIGPDSYRMELFGWLNGQKLTDGRQSMPVLIGGTVREIKGLSFRLTPEPNVNNPYPPAAQKIYEDMHELLMRRQLAPALVEAEKLCRLCPEVPMSHANIALIKEALSHPIDEVEALFRHAHELDEQYVFARAGLARVLARRGDVAAAKAMLEPVLSRDEYHYSEWRTILIAQREMALAQGENQAVLSIDQALDDLAKMVGQ